MNRRLHHSVAVLRTGWVPFLVVVAAFALMVHRAGGVSLHDVAVFLGYLAGWIVLPGTTVWRLVDPRRERRHLAEDLAIGALVGYVLEFPVYLGCLAIGLPKAYLAWPVVALAFLLATRRGRGLLHVGVGRLPLAWSWSVAAIMTYLIVWFGHYVWGPSPVDSESLRTPYIDEPFHLSLATSLRHFFPPRISYVADTPMDYHWLSHLHVAAASWVTGVEPIVLLHALAIPALILIVVFAAALIAMRLTGAAWTGIVLLGGLAVAPANFSAWSDGGGEPLLSTRLLASPSAGFVNAALMLGLLLCIELINRRERAWGALALTCLTFVAMAGAKSTSLPTLMAGLVAAALLGSLVTRKLHRRAALLAVLSGLMFEVARAIFFGSGSHGLAVDPLAFFGAQSRIYPGLMDADGQVQLDVRAVIAVSLVGYLTLAAGVLALLARGGWRRPDHVFLVVTCAAGFGAAMTFHQSSLSEYYFIYVVILPLLLGAVLGLHHVLEPLPRRQRIWLGSAGLLAGAAAALVYAWITQPLLPSQVTGSPLAQAAKLYALPAVVTLAVIATVVIVVFAGHRILSGARGSGSRVLVPIVVIACAGLGTGTFLRGLPVIASDPVPSPVAAKGQPLIAPGGIEAARWLRAHTDVDAVVATNAHCAYPAGRCVPRNFWMAGYSERQFLVEGWSYISRWSVGLHPPADENVTVGPFWDLPRLEANDRAFLHPSATTLDALKDDYGVSWLLVDLRYPVDRAALKEHATLEFRSGRYIVLKLR